MPGAGDPGCDAEARERGVDRKLVAPERHLQSVAGGPGGRAPHDEVESAGQAQSTNTVPRRVLAFGL